MRSWLDCYHGKGLPCVDREGLLPYEAELIALLASKTGTTYTQLIDFLEQKHGVTCSRNTMMHWMQAPFVSMESVSIDALSGIDHMNFLKDVYSKRPYISLYALRAKLAVFNNFRQTTDNKTMLFFPACNRGRAT